MSAADLVVEERLELLRWVAAPERLTYLAILAAFDDAKIAYEVQLRPPEVAARLGDLPIGGDEEALGRALDALAQWGVLERTFDSARVGSIAEYRRRRPVYQFSALGERAYRGVRELLGAREGEGQLQRFALRQLAEGLDALRGFAAVDDGERALAQLNQLDLVLGQLAERAAQFYVMVGSMTHQVDVDAARFVELKDLLLGHLHGFLDDLHRWAPTIAAGIASVEAEGIERVLGLVVAADESVFLTPAQRLAGWRARWDGLVSWFGPHQRQARVDELDRRTLAGIRELTALLRRLLDANARGAGRARDLGDLAAWFWSLDGRGSASVPHAASHALFAATFGLGGARHLALGQPDEDVIAASVPWADAPPVDVPVTLRTRGRAPAPGQTASVPDDRRIQAQLRALARQRLDDERLALDRLVSSPLDGRVIERSELEALLRLAELTLAAGVPVTGTVSVGSLGRVRMELRCSVGDTLVRSTEGDLMLRGVELTVVAA